jgi:prepilin-type N-terminal cleavage/methylation domain-containing protein
MTHPVELTSHRRTRFRRRTDGFTLIEASISIAIMSLLLLGTVNLFINASRMAVDGMAQVYATNDAANTLQQLVQSTREAYNFALADDPTDFAAPNGIPASSYTSDFTTTNTSSGTPETIYTGMLITFPPSAPATSVLLKAGAPSMTTFSQGNNDPLYYRSPTGSSAIGSQILYYRSDTQGNPSPASGSCLWEYSINDNGATFNQALIKTIAPDIDNAVQFVRPLTTANAVIPNEVEIKIICSSYSAINGAATNEATNGKRTTTLNGKCVLMRDANLSPSGTIPTGGNQVNNQFRGG